MKVSATRTSTGFPGAGSSGRRRVTGPAGSTENGAEKPGNAVGKGVGATPIVMPAAATHPPVTIATSVGRPAPSIPPAGRSGP